MNIYAGTLGQLVIVEGFVLYIWFKVLLETMRERDVKTPTLRTSYNKLLLTSIGLVLNAAAITGIIGFRIYELLSGNWPFVWGITAFYVTLALGNVMFILSASIGSNMRLIKVFAVVTVLWTLFITLVDVDKLVKGTGI